MFVYYLFNRSLNRFLMKKIYSSVCITFAPAVAMGVIVDTTSI